MAEFLTTHATAYNIENIILNAKHELILVSPYLQLSRTFFDRLKDADEKGIETVLIYGKDQLQLGERSQLGKLKNLSLFFCENLHAKCYLNEDQMVITSMNMYEFSEKNNREMGVLIKRRDDADVFDAALREVQSIQKASVKEEDKSLKQTEQPTRTPTRDRKPIPVPNAGKPNLSTILKETLSTILSSEKRDAFCIRCRDRLPFNPDYPLCDKCYSGWAEYNNPNYREHYCHLCGKQRKTTKAKPLCTSCFSKYT